MRDRKSTRLNSSHLVISYAVFCLKKKKRTDPSSICPPYQPPHPVHHPYRHHLSPRLAYYRHHSLHRRLLLHSHTRHAVPLSRRASAWSGVASVQDGMSRSTVIEHCDYGGGVLGMKR